jgi:hypothetical protein
MDTQKIIFDIDWLLDTFQLNSLTAHQLLTDWQSAQYSFDEAQKSTIQILSDLYLYEGDMWNEEELKMRLIIPILQLVNIEQKDKIKVFLERNIAAVIQKYRISVDVDLMIAKPKGKNTPQIPYFFLQELKKGKKSSNDPEAQMLAAMLAAQVQNNNGKPIFGGYMVGRNCFFSILVDRNYILSKQLDITETADLEQVIAMLKKLKEMVLA